MIIWGVLLGARGRGEVRKAAKHYKVQYSPEAKIVLPTMSSAWRLSFHTLGLRQRERA